MNIDASVLREKMKLKAEDYDFYRCYKCQRLITRVEEIIFFTPGHKRHGKVCKCGSQKYQPTNLKWYEWVYPKVWKFAYLRIRGIA